MVIALIWVYIVCMIPHSLVVATDIIMIASHASDSGPCEYDRKALNEYFMNESYQWIHQLATWLRISLLASFDPLILFVFCSQYRLYAAALFKNLMEKVK